MESQNVDASSRLDLLVAKQAEIDDLTAELERGRAEHSLAMTGYKINAEARKELLIDCEKMYRRLMEVPEAWEAVPEMGQLLVRLREEIEYVAEKNT